MVFVGNMNTGEVYEIPMLPEDIGLDMGMKTGHKGEGHCNSADSVGRRLDLFGE